MWCFERVASLHGVYVRMHSENKIQLSGGGMTHKLTIDFGCIKENKQKNHNELGHSWMSPNWYKP